MYDLPATKNASKVVVDEAVVVGETKPYVIYESEETLAAPEGKRRSSSSASLR
jgi:ATP-dependent Clp protease ATP-binding subunit ClpX